MFSCLFEGWEDTRSELACSLPLCLIEELLNEVCIVALTLQFSDLRLLLGGGAARNGLFAFPHMRVQDLRSYVVSHIQWLHEQHTVQLPFARLPFFDFGSARLPIAAMRGSG